MRSLQPGWREVVGLAQRFGVPVGALAALARGGTSAVIELVLTNQERLLSQPDLLNLLSATEKYVEFDYLGPETDTGMARRHRHLLVAPRQGVRSRRHRESATHHHL